MFKSLQWASTDKNWNNCFRSSLFRLNTQTESANATYFLHNILAKKHRRVRTGQTIIELFAGNEKNVRSQWSHA